MIKNLNIGKLYQVHKSNLSQSTIDMVFGKNKQIFGVMMYENLQHQNLSIEDIKKRKTFIDTSITGDIVLLTKTFIATLKQESINYGDFKYNRSYEEMYCVFLLGSQLYFIDSYDFISCTKLIEN